MERCRSGRTGRSRKPLSSLRGTEGSNPSLSANPPFMAGSPRPTLTPKAAAVGHILFPAVSPSEWGNEMGNVGTGPLSRPSAPEPGIGHGADRQTLGGGGIEDEGAGSAARRRWALLAGFPPLAPKHGFSGSSSTGSAATWGLAPSPISRSRRRAGARESTGTSAAMGIDPLDAKAAQRQAKRVAVAKGRTFRECANEFIEKNRAGWRNPKHRQQRETRSRPTSIPVWEICRHRQLIPA